MSTRYLEFFFKPESIVVIGASERTLSMGGIVIQNLQSAKFTGRIYAVNRRPYKTIFDISCYKTVNQLPRLPDLAIICTPPSTLPELVLECAKKGIRAILILTGGLSRAESRSQENIDQKIKDVIRRYGIRVMGPDCLGLVVPKYHLNASFAHTYVQNGKVAYIGQSGILGTAMLDWAKGRNIGLSHLLTLGVSIDVDMADVIDYIASDWYTKQIVLQLEVVHGARRFISALRAISRGKKVLALKSGQFPESQFTPIDIPAGLSDRDRIHDSVLSRAGALRVQRGDELLQTLETLTFMRPLRGEKLALVSNGIGPLTLSVDALLKLSGKMATLSDNTISELDAILPIFWGRKNPVDLNADASPERFVEACQILLKDPGVDNLLVLHGPTQFASSGKIASALIELNKKTRLNLLVTLLGEATAGKARDTLRASGLAAYATPDEAIRAYMHMVRHQRSQALLRQTPAKIKVGQPQAKIIVGNLLASIKSHGRNFLLPLEMREVLSQYNIPTVPTWYAENTDQALKNAAEIGYPLAMQAIHETYCFPFQASAGASTHWRGISTNLQSDDQLLEAAETMRAWVNNHFAGKPLKGYIQQKMLRGLQAIPLSAGITRDAVFGPVIFLGPGGVGPRAWKERQVALPPLNVALAEELISRTSSYGILRETTGVDSDTLAPLSKLLVSLSQMIINHPEISALEINPILMTENGLQAIDATLSLGAPVETVIRPYPEKLSEKITLPLSGKTVIIRPIRAEDEPSHVQFHESLSLPTIRYRFFSNRTKISHEEMAQMTQIDYDREMAFVAKAENTDGEWETLGVVRTVTDADNVRCEFAVVIRDTLKGERLGHALMEKMIRYCTDRGTLEMYGQVLSDNEPMLKLGKRLGFTSQYNSKLEVIEQRLQLNKPSEEWQQKRLAQYG